jgi:hypothetical protein
MFIDDLEELINKHSLENESDTPDWILAKYIRGCLDAWKDATKSRDQWYGFHGLSGTIAGALVDHDILEPIRLDDAEPACPPPVDTDTQEPWIW